MRRSTKTTLMMRPSLTPPPAPMRTSSISSVNPMDSTHLTHDMNEMENTINGAGDADTFERHQPHRHSWLMNMRRRGAGGDLSHHEPMSANTTAITVTPSPQTLRSYVTAGTGSGRTTATSGRMSSSGVATISGSSNTLNDISDYHSQNDAATTASTNISDDFHRHHHNHNQQQQRQQQHHKQKSHHHLHQHLDHSFADSNGTPLKNYLSNASFNTTLANGSTAKLLPNSDDNANQQTKCSVFRGLVLCICLNVTYANIVRFPRELDKHGTAYLIPYLTLLFLVGLPILLLEIALGQFLGQGAAHTWRASPIFKGACIIGRFASWLSTVWISLQAVLALGYIGMFLFDEQKSDTKSFRECIGGPKIAQNGYSLETFTGQECLLKTFLTPFWENPFFYGVLSIGLICIWIVVMLCTHNSRILRRSLFMFGLLGFVLLCTLTGWEVRHAIQHLNFPQLWVFEPAQLYASHIWFNALMQVLFATNCGLGALPMLTGKFLYKGDAVRTAIVFLCFNLLINAIAVTLFIIQFAKSSALYLTIEELKPLTAIYDRMLNDVTIDMMLMKILTTGLYALIFVAAFITIIVSIYTATRLVPRHPNYFICLMALVMAIISFAAPRFMIASILDSRIVGTMIVTALIFDLIAITWIYGAKNIYTDLEFSIGRPIFKLWMYLWYIGPAILTGLLVWWCSDVDEDDLLAEYVPRWAPILFVLGIICIIACIQIFRQVEYNFFGMICEASKPAKEWGPADPLARHAWKQWRSVCQDTGRRDFTLRRRGTRDYTHSIKNTAKYANGGVGGGKSNIDGNQSAAVTATHQQHQQQNWKTTTPGNSSPNYSGSMFGDSAIEEDISVDKFPGVTHQSHQQQFVPFHHTAVGNGNGNDNNNSDHDNGNKPPMRYSQHAVPQQQPRSQPVHPIPHHQSTKIVYHHQSHERLAPLAALNNINNSGHNAATVETHREVVYIRRLSGDNGQQHATRIEITPSNECITYGGINGSRNPMARMHAHDAARVKRSASASGIFASSNASKYAYQTQQQPAPPPPPPPPSHIIRQIDDQSEHVCWRKYTPATHNNLSIGNGIIRHEDATEL